MTIRERVSAALRVRGYSWVRGRSRRLHTYQHPEDPNNKWYLGPSGSVTQGRTATAAWSVSEATKQQLIGEGEQLLSIVSYGPVDEP